MAKSIQKPLRNIFSGDAFEAKGMGIGMRSSGSDIDLLSDAGAQQELNTYRQLPEFTVPVEPIKWPEEIDKATPDEANSLFTFPPGSQPGFLVRHSLFNWAHGVADNTWYQLYNNSPLLDTPETRKLIRSRSDCSVKTLVKESAEGHMGRAIYRYSDFMFCKHLGRISNNYLITLRRFPFPAGDHINFDLPEEEKVNEHLNDIGRMVTWMGTPGNDMSGILKYSVGLPYKEMKAEVQTDNRSDNSGSFLGGMLNLASGSNQNAALKGYGGSDAINFTKGMMTRFGGPAASKAANNLAAPPANDWAYFHDRQKPWGPVDTVAKTYIRESPDESGGVKFEHSIKLVFEYEMRSFDGINAKAAFLDLLGNILAVCYTDARWWGGTIRATGASQSNVFANLPIFNMGSPLSLSGLADAGMKSFAQITGAFNNGKPISGLGDLLNAGKNFLKGAATAGISGLLNAIGRPQKQGFNSLLTAAPTGVWHLTIGNPRHPIMAMGNMKLDDVSIEHTGALGLDDFPTGLKVEISLSHAMPRDNLRIEQMYYGGDYRVYYPLGEKAYSIWKNAAELSAGNEKPTPTKTAQSTTTTIDTKDTQPEDDIQSTLNLSQTSKSVKNILWGFVGAVKSEAITIAGQEAHQGSQSKQPASSDGEQS